MAAIREYDTRRLFADGFLGGSLSMLAGTYFGKVWRRIQSDFGIPREGLLRKTLNFAIVQWNNWSFHTPGGVALQPFPSRFLVIESIRIQFFVSGDDS